MDTTNVLGLAVKQDYGTQNKDHEYMFIIRRNPVLSVNEATSYLTARSVHYTIGFSGSEYATFSIRDFNPQKAMEQIGETLKIGEVIAKAGVSAGRKKPGRVMPPQEMKNILEHSLRFPDEFVSRAQDASLLGVSFYPRYVEFPGLDFHALGELVGEIVVSKLKAEGGLKRSLGILTAKDFKHEGRADITPIDARRKDLHDKNLELLVGLESGGFCVAATVAVCDQEALNRRGVDRPSRPAGWKYGMAPNYAKALVNLCGAKKGDVLLDPFCGIGTILQEAALNGVKVLGVDVNRGCVESSKENLGRISKEYRLGIQDLGERVKVGDATRLSEFLAQDSVDAIATEPYLGPALEKRPKYDYARDMLRKLRPLYEGSLSEMCKVLKPGKKAVVVAPIISSSNGALSLNLREPALRCGFRFLKSILDSRAHQLVSRELVILEKTAQDYI